MEREINDLENWIATVNEYLDALAREAQTARSLAQIRSIDLRTKAQLRRLASLKARRQALKKQLGGK
jgi:hypothetical protein